MRYSRNDLRIESCELLGKQSGINTDKYQL